MSANEKDAMRNTLSVFMHSHPPKAPIPSPSWMHAHAHIAGRFAFATLGVFLLVTVPVVYASGKSLPGDMLYPVKVSVVEPTSEFLAFKPEERVQRIVEHSEQRVKETALVRGDAGKVSVASAALKETAERGQRYLEKTEDLSLDEKIETQKDLLSSLEAHEILAVNAEAHDKSAIRNTRLTLEDNLIETVELLVDSEGSEETLKHIASSIEKIQEKIESPMEEEQRLAFEKGIQKTNTELSEGDTEGALRAIILSEQDASVFDLLDEALASTTPETAGEQSEQSLEENPSTEESTE